VRPSSPGATNNVGSGVEGGSENEDGQEQNEAPVRWILLARSESLALIPNAGRENWF
jgi:hypothetical protein